MRCQKVRFADFRLPVFLLALFSLSGAATLCSYAGPDVSDDLVKLENFTVTGSSDLSEGDSITVKFNLTSWGQGDLALGSKGIFAAALDPDGDDASFGFSYAKTAFEAGETLSIKKSLTLDKAGTWVVWPSYQLSTQNGNVLGPDEWHACTLKVRAARNDSDQDGVWDEDDNCPLISNPEQDDGDDDGAGDECDNCPSVANPDQNDSNQNGIGDACDRDTVPPVIVVSHAPANATTASNITFTAVATDNANVSRISIYINKFKVKECAPPEYNSTARNWKCAYSNAGFPQGILRYSAEATDSGNNTAVSTEWGINVTAPVLAAPPLTMMPLCLLSGTLLNFSYYSKTLAVKICEAEVIGAGCLPVPPYTCFGGGVTCKEGSERTVNVTRVWAGEEAYRNPGPMEYRATVACNGTYYIRPAYQPYGDECEWNGSWIPSRSNTVTMGNSSLTDYNFTFRPADIQPPSISRVVFPQNSSAFHLNKPIWTGSSAEILRAEAYDAGGIRRIRMRGNLTAIGSVSGLSGPLSGAASPGIANIFNFSKECNSSPCVFNITSAINTSSFSRVNFSVWVEACDKAGNKVSSAYSRAYAPYGDLEIVSVEPVQVLYGAPLVKGKNTAFRIKVNSYSEYGLETKIRLGWPAGDWRLFPVESGETIIYEPTGWSYPEVWGPIWIPAGVRNYSVMLPIIPDWQKNIDFDQVATPAGMIGGGHYNGIYGLKQRVLPKPARDYVSVWAELDPGNELDETNESNNWAGSPVYRVLNTKRWKFLFVPYRDDSGCAPYDVYVKNAAKRYMEYVLATFPIADGKIEYAFAEPSFWQNCTHNASMQCGYVRAFNVGRASFLTWMARLAQDSEENYDFAVAIGCGDGGGASGESIMAVFVGDSGIEEVLAHEFNHVTAPVDDMYSLDCYSSWDESYCEISNASKFYCCWDHYDGEKDAREDAGINPYSGCTVDCGEDWDECGRDCCRARCEAQCNRSNGTTWTSPDLRPGTYGLLPAADGFWANRWAGEGGRQYFMDGPRGDNWMTMRSVMEEGFHYCPSPDADFDSDGYLNIIYNGNFASAEDPEGILVSGTIGKGGSASLDPFIYLPNTTLDRQPGSNGTYYFVLYDSDGAALSRTGFTASFYMPDPHGGPVNETSFSLRIEWKNGTTRMELQDRNGTVLATRLVSRNAPQVKVIHPNGGESFAIGDKIKISWDASDADGDALSYSLAISAGAGWIPLDMDVSGTEYELDTSGMEKGANYSVRVRATDGVNSARDASDSAFSIGEAAAQPSGAVPPAGGAAEKPPQDYLAIAAIVLLMVLLAFAASRLLAKKPEAR